MVRDLNGRGGLTERGVDPERTVDERLRIQPRRIEDGERLLDHLQRPFLLHAQPGPQLQERGRVRALLALERKRLPLDLELRCEHLDTSLGPEREEALRHAQVDAAGLEHLALGVHQVALLQRVHEEPLHLELDVGERAYECEVSPLVYQRLFAVRLEGGAPGRVKGPGCST
jgi:hypothetical protein